VRKTPNDLLTCLLTYFVLVFGFVGGGRRRVSVAFVSFFPATCNGCLLVALFTEGTPCEREARFCMTFFIRVSFVQYSADSKSDCLINHSRRHIDG